MSKSPDAFRTISEAANELGLPQHVLRFWETRFSHIKPLKRGGGRRYYRPDDVDLLKGIQHLLYSEGYTIKGVQRILKEQGVHAVVSAGNGQDIRAGDGRNGTKQAVPVNGAMSAGEGAGEGAAAGETVGQAAPAGDEREKLQAVLSELLECKRMLDQSRQANE